MFLKVLLFILQIFGTDMSEQELKEQLGDELCEFCPWRKGEIDHTFDSLCEGSYCDDAFDNFLDENEGYFDDEEIITVANVNTIGVILIQPKCIATS